MDANQIRYGGYLIDSNSNVPTPLIGDFFRAWVSSKGFKSIDEILDYAKELDIKDIGLDFGWQNSIVKADMNRPYLLINAGNVYLAIHTIKQHRVLDKIGDNPTLNNIIRGHQEISSAVNHYWEISKKQDSFKYNLDYGFDKDLLDGFNVASNQVGDVNYFLRDTPFTYDMLTKTHIPEDYTWGWMFYSSVPTNELFRDINQEGIVNLKYRTAPIQRYDLIQGQVCWGFNEHDQGNRLYHRAFYLDELMELTSSGGPAYLNWLRNPMAKSIKIYNQMVREETKRRVELERKNKVEKEFNSYSNYAHKKMVKFYNQRKKIMSGNKLIEDGLYYDYERVNYLLHTYRKGEIMPNMSNQTLSQIIVHLTNITSRSNRVNNGNWPKLHIFMKDLFGSNYNMKLKMEEEGASVGDINEIYNWTTWGVNVGEFWYKEIIDSGIDLSYYLTDSNNPAWINYYGKVEMAEDTLIFDFDKANGPLDKSKYYAEIRNEIQRYKERNGRVLVIMPKCFFIKYEGGELI
jgi:hypothetical protein